MARTHFFMVEGEPLHPCLKGDINFIELNRGSIKFICDVDKHAPRLVNEININDENALDLINFACELLYILREKIPDFVKPGTFRTLRAAKASTELIRERGSAARNIISFLEPR